MVTKVKRFSYVTPHRRGMLHLAYGKLGDDSKLACGRRMKAGWQFAMSHSGLALCTQCQGHA
jgi:hypothetical protein